MEMERIALSQRERDRLKVLREVEQRHLTQLQATQRLQLTDRQVRRLLLRSTRAEMVHWFTDSAADHRTAGWRPPWSRRFWRGYASGARSDGTQRTAETQGALFDKGLSFNVS